MYNRYLQELTRYNAEPESEAEAPVTQAPAADVPVEREQPHSPERPRLPEQLHSPERPHLPERAHLPAEKAAHRGKLFDLFSFDRFKKDDLLLVLLLLFVFSECEDDFETLIGIGFLLLLGL